ncbi:MAG: hypothetical protein GX999_11455 [Bacteroidales bacterium]|nr:hypothetical protein [Bacteroidales bacterium]
MINLTINNIKITASDEDTILSAAVKAGINIPTLCHKNGVEHYSSCMVCIVRDIKKNSYLPSCSAPVKEGMEIDASSDEVISMRKKAIELLLLEHRAECEAPCRIVCPAGYNIPLMNRMLAEKNFRGVSDLIRAETETNKLNCINCKAYCENACRRKKIDKALTIRKTRIFIYESLKKHEPGKPVNNQEADSDLQRKVSLKEQKASVMKRFSSRTGTVGDKELQEWLKECTGDGSRHSTINDFDSASKEAGNCMHCDCRAANDCRLRELAEAFSIKDPSGKIFSLPLTKKINHKTGLIFENGKCIKCGLCVRVFDDSKEEPTLCFINRGFISVISEPLTEEFDRILSTQVDKCVKVCPTGALSKFR